MRTHAVVGTGCLALAAGVALVVLLGPLFAGAIEYRTSESALNQLKGADLASVALVAPASLLAGVLWLRRSMPGLWLAVSLLVLEVLLAPLIAAQTVSQLIAGVEFTAGEVIGPTAGFVAISLAALWVLAIVLRDADA